MDNGGKNGAGSELTARSLFIGSVGSAVITASSMYVALRMSALPWPTIFVAVLSMSLLRAMGKSTINEVNVASTAMSAGAMVAGGIAFTLPGLFILGIWDPGTITAGDVVKVISVALGGVILGSLVTSVMRRKFIVEDKLPFPIGEAAANTLRTGFEGGLKSGYLYISMAASAVFTFLRDSLGVIPAAFSSAALYARNIYVGMWFSPMAVGIGYMIGPLFCGVWFLGSVLSYFVIIPLGTAFGIFATAEAAVAFKNTAGIGFMVGTGLGTLISFVAGLLRARQKKSASSGGRSRFRARYIAFPVAAFIFTVLAGVPAPAAAIAVALSFVASAMSGTITGQTGINPMEIFAIIVLLAVRLLVTLTPTQAFFVAALVAIVCGYAGDMMNDYKAGHILGTDPFSQLVSEIFGGVVGALVAGVAMFAVIGQFGGVGAEFGIPAGQAFAVSQMVAGIGDPLVFGIAALIGAALNLMKFPVMTFGIGMYLAFEISAPMFVGGLLSLIMGRLGKRDESADIVASGLLGGEGVCGVVVAIVKMLTMS